MHRIKLFLLLLVIPLAVFAAPVPKTEVALLGHVTTRISGSPVVVTGYKFYISKVSDGSYITPAAATVPESASEIKTTLVSLIPPPAKGTYYIYATSYLGPSVSAPAGEESAISNPVAVYANGDGTFFTAAPLGVPGPLELR